jgi:hypothetical protein
MIEDMETMRFALSLVVFIHERYGDILSSPVNRPASTHNVDVQFEINAYGTAIDRIIHRLMTATSDYVVSNLQNRMAVYDGLVVLWEESDEVITFVRFCLNAGQNAMCQKLLDAVLEAPGNEASKLHNLQIPIVQNLCLLLQESKSSIYSPPFAPFFRQVIERYFQLLGSKTHNPQLDWLFRLIERRFNCTCDDCVKLNAFMKQVYVRHKTFRVSRKGFRHFQIKIGAAYELARFEAVNSPHGFCIKVIKAAAGPFGEQRWEGRIKAFKEFLALIGDEEVIAKVMEERYANLKEIMEG